MRKPFEPLSSASRTRSWDGTSYSYTVYLSEANAAIAQAKTYHKARLKLERSKVAIDTLNSKRELENRVLKTEIDTLSATLLAIVEYTGPNKLGDTTGTLQNRLKHIKELATNALKETK